MNSRLLRTSPLQLWLGVLAALASVAALQASLLPRWPRARPLPAAAISNALRQAGIAAQPLPPGAAAAQGKRSHELATSAPLAYRLTGAGQGAELRLLRGTVRQRDNLQAALFARDHRDLRLERRRLEPGPPSWALGTISGRPALQTCWVAGSSPDGGFGVTAEQLLPLVDSQARGRRAELLRILGLQANRDYSCVLISLRSGDKEPLPSDLASRLFQALSAGLNSPGGADAGHRRIP